MRLRAQTRDLQARAKAVQAAAQRKEAHAAEIFRKYGHMQYFQSGKMDDLKVR